MVNLRKKYCFGKKGVDKSFAAPQLHLSARFTLKFAIVYSRLFCVTAARAQRASLVLTRLMLDGVQWLHPRCNNTSTYAFLIPQQD